MNSPAASPLDHVLVVGFGAPGRPEEVAPFLDNFAWDFGIPRVRLEEVARHYAAIGGASPYNAGVESFARALESRLRSEGCRLPVLVGMRHWRPWLRETVREAAARGLRRGLALILAPHRSEASFGRYVAGLEAAQDPAKPVRYECPDPWHGDPRFVEAWAARIEDALRAAGGRAKILFSAHSLPKKAPDARAYADAVRATGRLVAARLGRRDATVVFQSRSGRPEDPWLGPDVLEAVRRFARRSTLVRKVSRLATILVAPVGFLCENAETLYDLDVEARRATEGAGLRYLRVRAVLDHPKVLEMFAQFVLDRARPGVTHVHS
jgi:ferrochelatase